MIISATGHRPDKLGGYGNLISARLENLAGSWLHTNKLALNITDVIVGMAQGWDMAVARACIAQKIPFIAAIPFPGQEKMWPIAKQIHYKWILSLADEIVIVSKGKYTSKKMQKRNEYMVDHSNLILAMWDGSAGGTANCLNYAVSRSKTIVNLYSLY